MLGVAEAESVVVLDKFRARVGVCTLDFRPFTISRREEVVRFSFLYNRSNTELVPVDIVDVDCSSLAIVEVFKDGAILA